MTGFSEWRRNSAMPRFLTSWLSPFSGKFMPTDPNSSAVPVRRGSRWSFLWRLALLGGLLILINYGAAFLPETLENEIQPYLQKWGNWVLLISLLVFGLILALPFVPGMELGLAIMMLFDLQGVFLVYGASLMAFSLSYSVGRWIPMAGVAGMLRWLHLERSADFVRRVGELPPGSRLLFLLRASPGKWVPLLLRHRYLALALALNVPGNSFVGGGGGISLLVGMTGVYAYPAFLLTTALAILPVPLMFLAKHLYF